MVDMNVLEERVAELEKMLALYPSIRKIAKAFDGKVMNKKFVDAVEAITVDGVKLYATYASSGRSHNLTIFSNLNKDDLVRVYNVEMFGAVADKRLNYSKLEDAITCREESFKREITALKRDIENGLERLNAFNALVEKARELKSQFSYKFLEVNQYDFYSIR